MSVRPIGSQWLKEHFGLDQHSLTHVSYMGSSPSIELTSKGTIEEVFRMQLPDDRNTPLHHLEISLKYDNLNLDFLREVFNHIKPGEIVAHVEDAPGSKYVRKIGFLYEFLTNTVLKLSRSVSGNYTDLLDDKKYITGSVVKDARWRINNNLLGTPAFCPIVRAKKELLELLQEDITFSLESLRREFGADEFKRAIRYLYKKETRSSYQIEREEPAADRLDKFILLLEKAGTDPEGYIVSKDKLLALQHAIVDPRYRANGFRDHTIYVGESLPNFEEFIHYIAPAPEQVDSLMDGLCQTSVKSADIPPVVKAAILSFGFVFVHPFEDGNGRIHRFLIHDILGNSGLVPTGMIVPISAHMLQHMDEYDQILEKYSKPLMRRIRYRKNPGEEIELLNAEEVDGYYRYPDLTDHCLYLYRTLLATIRDDMPGELLFIARYDKVRKEIARIVDMPDRRLHNLLQILHQNKGVFPKRRRPQFSELSEEEIAQMEQTYQAVFLIT